MNSDEKHITTLPHIERDESTVIHLETVTLRDHFAMAALTGMLNEIPYNDQIDSYCKKSYQIADQMLEARK